MSITLYVVIPILSIYAGDEYQEACSRIFFTVALSFLKWQKFGDKLSVHQKGNGFKLWGRGRDPKDILSV